MKMSTFGEIPSINNGKIVQKPYYVYEEKRDLARKNPYHKYGKYPFLGDLLFI